MTSTRITEEQKAAIQRAIHLELLDAPTTSSRIYDQILAILQPAPEVEPKTVPQPLLDLTTAIELAHKQIQELYRLQIQSIPEFIAEYNRMVNNQLSRIVSGGEV